MLKKVLAAGAVAAAVVSFAMPASAGQVCVQVTLTVADQTVSQAQCVDTP